MLYPYRPLLLLLVLLGTCRPGAAQAQGSPAGEAPVQAVRQVEAGFERDVNRYRWAATARYGAQLGRWNVALTNRFSSDAFLLFADRLSFRDENLLEWHVGRPLRRGLSLQARGRGGWFSQSRVASQELYAGVRYAVRPYAWVEPVAGVAWDRRPGAGVAEGVVPLRLDAGPAFGLRAHATPPLPQGYQLAVQADGSLQQITPRRGHALRLNSTLERTFEEIRLSAGVALSSLRRDAYQAVSFLNRGTPTGRLSETVEATTSDTLLAALSVEAPFYRGIRLTGRVDFAANDRFTRTLRAPEEALFFDTDFGRRALEAEVALLHERPRLTARLAARGGAEVERRRLENRALLPPTQATQKSDLLQQADYDRGLVTLSSRILATPLRRLTLSFDGTASILRHDTPAINPDDRDEVYHHGQLGVLLELSRYFQADVQLLGTFYHTVYLNAARSAENNVQRSLRLRPAFQWTPTRETRVRLSTEVRATYTVDDFVLPGRRPTDQSARELRYDLELDHDLGGGLRLLGTGSYRTLHLGRLLWDRFAEIPFDTLRTYSGWLRLQAGRRVTADVGVRFFLRSDYNPATTVRYPRVDAAGSVVRDETGTPLATSITRPGRDWIEQMGPTCTISWPMRRGSTLILAGWLNVQHLRQRLYGSLPDGAAERIRAAARDGTRTIVPNVALTMRWNL